MAEGMPPSGSGGGGPTSVPISATAPQQVGQYVYNNVTYNVFYVGLTSTTGSEVTGISVSAPSGCYVATVANPNPMQSSVTVSAPAAGTQAIYTFVPNSNNNTVSDTVSKSGYNNVNIPIQSPG